MITPVAGERRHYPLVKSSTIYVMKRLGLARRVKGAWFNCGCLCVIYAMCVAVAPTPPLLYLQNPRHCFYRQSNTFSHMHTQGKHCSSVKMTVMNFRHVVMIFQAIETCKQKVLYKLFSTVKVADVELASDFYHGSDPPTFIQQHITMRKLC